MVRSNEGPRFPSTGAIALLVVAGVGCGSSASGGWAERSVAPEGEQFAAMASTGDYAISPQAERRATATSDWDAVAPAPPAGGAIAQATPAAGSTPGSGASPPPATATDALPADAALLIYTAQLTLAVHHVEAQQNALLELCERLGGHLTQRNATTIVVRIPARRFREALAATEGLGDVLARDVRSEDVGEEFRDTTVRLRNLEVMRERLEALLTRAQNVNDAIAVEREMQRVTQELERLRGRLRYLENQIAFSTITVNFRPRVTEPTYIDQFQLPFVWLNRLGLPRLLEVR